MNSNVWKFALLLLPILGHAAEFTTPTRFSAPVEFGQWTNTATITQATNLTGGAATATGTFSFAIQPTNSLGRGVVSAASNASFTATGQLIRIRWSPAGGATGYRIFRGLTNWIDVGAATQFLFYGTNTWSNGAPTTTTTAGAFSGPLVVPTNSFLGSQADSNRLARMGDVVAGTVTNGQWLPDVYAVGIAASGALQRTGGTVTGTVTITGTNLVGHRVAVTGGGDYVPMIGRSSAAFLTGFEYLSGSMIAGFVVATNPAATGPNIFIGHDLSRSMIGAFQSFGGLADLSGTDSGDFWRLQYAYFPGTTTTLARVVGSASGGFAPQLIVSNAVLYGDGSGLTNLPISAGVTLRTNPVLKVSASPGLWSVSSDVPTNGGGAVAFELPTATSTQYRATFRTISTATVSRTIQGPVYGLSAVATNVKWFVFDHITSTNFPTNVVSVAAAGTTATLFSVTCTTTALYYVSGTNAAGNRDFVATVTTSGSGPGSTNFGRAIMPLGYLVEQ